MRLVALLFVATILTGCANVPAPPGTPSPTSHGSLAPSFGEPVQVASLADQDADPVTFLVGKQLALFEPTLAFAPDGSAWVSAPACPASEGNCASHTSHIWHGTTAFKDVTPKPEKNTTGNGDSAVRVEPDGAVLMADQGTGQYVYRSADNGSSWTRAVVTNESADRPFMDAVGGVTVFIVDKGGVQSFATSLDEGRTWTPLTPAVSSLKFPAGNVRALDARTWAFPYFDEQDPSPGIPGNEKCGSRTVTVKVALTRDAGASWARIDTGASYQGVGEENAGSCSPGAVLPTFDVSPDARAWRVAWAQPGPTGPRVRVVSSLDGGATWGPPSAPAGDDASSVMPWVVTRGQDDIIVAYYHSNTQGDPGLVPSSWSLEVAWSGDDGKTWKTSSLGVAHVGTICLGGGGCSSGDRSLGDLFQVARGADGRVGLAWIADMAAPAKGTRLLFAEDTAS